MLRVSGCSSNYSTLRRKSLLVYRTSEACYTAGSISCMSHTAGSVDTIRGNDWFVFQSQTIANHRRRRGARSAKVKERRGEATASPGFPDLLKLRFSRLISYSKQRNEEQACLSDSRLVITLQRKRC